MNYAMLDNAWRIMPGKVSLTLTPMSVASGVTTPGTDVTCVGYRKLFRERSLANGGSFQSTNDNAVWILQDSTLDSNEPKLGDVLTDDLSVAWTVNSVTRDGMGSRWVCNCTRRQ